MWVLNVSSTFLMVEATIITTNLAWREVSFPAERKRNRILPRDVPICWQGSLDLTIIQWAPRSPFPLLPVVVVFFLLPLLPNLALGFVIALTNFSDFSYWLWAHLDSLSDHSFRRTLDNIGVQLWELQIGLWCLWFRLASLRFWMPRQGEIGVAQPKRVIPFPIPYSCE